MLESRAVPAPALPRVDAEARPLRSRTILLGLLVGLPLSALFLYLAFRKADVAEVWRSITGANAAPLSLAVVAMGVVYAFQADRWRWIAQGDDGLSRTHYAGLVVGGVACNNVLPGRLGDLLRAFWLRRDAPMPGGRALATVIVDRACD